MLSQGLDRKVEWRTAHTVHSFAFSTQLTKAMIHLHMLMFLNLLIDIMQMLLSALSARIVRK